MKIIHISDLHLCTSYNSKNLDKTIALFEHISNAEFDHLVITGDITHTAEKEDFVTFREILQNFNLLDPLKTSIVIGNHDIFGGVVTAEDVINFSGKCKATNYERKVREFYEYFKELFIGCIFSDGETIFPYLKIVDNVVFIGMNSIAGYSLIKNPLASNGRISKIQIQELKRLLKKNVFTGKKKIALTHHHFSKFTKDTTHLNNPIWDRIEKSTMKLWKKKKTLNELKKMNVELVLHGHLHKGQNYQIDDTIFVNSGDSVDNSYKNIINYQIINLDDIITNTQIKIDLNPSVIFTEDMIS